jgi:hypothetical protein
MDDINSRNTSKAGMQATTGQQNHKDPAKGKMLAKVVKLETAFTEANNNMETIYIRDDSSRSREAGNIHQGHQQDLTTRILTLVGMIAAETKEHHRIQHIT